MGLFETGGSFPAGLTPSPSKTLFSGNYLTFDSATGGGTFAQQFLPDVYEKEVERYGNRSVSSFLRMVGAEIPSASDQVIWSEQGRLHIAYDAASANTGTNVITENGHAVRAGQTVAVAEGLVTVKAVVISVTTDTFTVAPYAEQTLDAAGLSTGTDVTVKVFVYGSEFAKGSAGMTGSIDAGFQQFSNSPIIIKDKYSISGSDAAQIGWVEVTTENGASGYLWYLKSEHETRLRFEDYMELSLIEGEPAVASSGAETAGYKGTKGLFYEIENRGNIATGSIAARTDLEELIKVLDKEGAIQENVLFVNRTKSFEIDNVLAAQNNSGASTSSYGLFDNDEEMAISLGFKGFNLGYDFYKTDWKYLNDATTGALTSAVDGVLVPAGTTTIYDQVLGKNAVRPFLHVKYRKSEAEDRKYKSWITGSAGNAGMTSDLDAMEVHFLSERALCVHGANNFILLK